MAAKSKTPSAPSSWTVATRKAAKELKGIRVAKVSGAIKSEKSPDIKRAVKEYFGGKEGRTQTKR